jgi:hypothetical protein
VCLFHLLYHHFFFFLPLPFPVSVASRHPGHATPCPACVAAQNKKGNHATAAVLHVSRVTSQMRPCLVLARGFALVCAPLCKRKQRQFVQKNKQKKKKTGQEGRSVRHHLWELVSGSQRVFPPLSSLSFFFLCLFSFALVISNVCDGLSTLI